MGKVHFFANSMIPMLCFPVKNVQICQILINIIHAAFEFYLSLQVEVNALVLNMKKLMIAMLPAFAVACGNPEAETSALDLTNLDTSVSPADDFYRYATGGWQDKNPLKPEFSRYGVLDILSENNQKRLNDLFKSMGQSSPMPGSVEQKISDLYKMGLDSVRLNSEGAAPIRQMLDKVLSSKDRRGVMEAITELHSAADYPFFSAYVAADLAELIARKQERLQRLARIAGDHPENLPLPASA